MLERDIATSQVVTSRSRLRRMRSMLADASRQHNVIKRAGATVTLGPDAPSWVR